MRRLRIYAHQIVGADDIVIECDHEKNKVSLTVYSEFDSDFHETKQGLELATITETGSGNPVDVQTVVKKYPFRDGSQPTSNPFLNPELLIALSHLGKLSHDRLEGLEISTGENLIDAVLFRTHDKRWTAYVMPMNHRWDYGRAK